MEPTPSAPPVRLLEAAFPSPYAPGREAVLARVAGDGLAALDIHDGDHVVLARRDGPGHGCEHGDVAAVLEADGTAGLWKVSPEGDRLRLSLGRPGTGRLTPPGPRVHGVVVAVLRKLR